MSLNSTTANLVIDWIGFKFQNLDDVNQEKLAKYLFKSGSPG